MLEFNPVCDPPQEAEDLSRRVRWSLTRLDSSLQSQPAVEFTARLDWADDDPFLVGWDRSSRLFLNDRDFPIAILRLLD